MTKRDLLIVVGLCVLAMFIASDFYPWPFDPPSIHRVKPSFGG